MRAHTRAQCSCPHAQCTKKICFTLNIFLKKIRFTEFVRLRIANIVGQLPFVLLYQLVIATKRQYRIATERHALLLY